jgi:hypothetical protein
MITQAKLNNTYNQYREGLISEVEMAITIRDMANKVITRIKARATRDLNIIKQNRNKIKL